MNAIHFKTLTPENLLHPDPLTTSFGNVLDPRTGDIHDMTRDEFLSYIFEPRLTDAVPEDVRTLFEAGRAAMCYGYFFYPLFMLGFERSCGAGEAAVRRRARDVGATRRSSFSEDVEILLKEVAISPTEKDCWDAIRMARNEAAHPKFQQLMMPGPCITMLAVIADAINQLFTAGGRGAT